MSFCYGTIQKISIYFILSSQFICKCPIELDAAWLNPFYRWLIAISYYKQAVFMDGRGQSIFFVNVLSGYS